MEREPLELWEAHARIDDAPDHDAHARDQHTQHGLGVDPAQPGVHHGDVPFWVIESKHKYLE